MHSDRKASALGLLSLYTAQLRGVRALIPSVADAINDDRCPNTEANMVVHARPSQYYSLTALTHVYHAHDGLQKHGSQSWQCDTPDFTVILAAR
jgi:hypothetical protein